MVRPQRKLGRGRTESLPSDSTSIKWSPVDTEFRGIGE